MRVTLSYYAICHLRPEDARTWAWATERVPPDQFRFELDTDTGKTYAVFGGEFGERVREIASNDPLFEGKFEVTETE